MSSDNDGLTPAQVSAFQRDGYLIIPDALPQETVRTLLDETHRLLRDELDLAGHPMTRFRTGGADGKGDDHVGDAYFLGSGDKVRFFFEEDAFDPQNGGALRVPKERAINKIGHYLHGLSAPFASLLVREPNSNSSSTSSNGVSAKEGEKGRYIPHIKARPASVARALGYRDPRCLQSMVICKQPGIGGAVPPHQDSSFLYTSPPSALGFWYALEDATVDNGCLSFLPGSHRWAPVRRRLVRKVPGAGRDQDGTEMVENGGGAARFPPGEEYGEDKKNGDEGEYVLGEVKAGSLVLIHGNLLHKSERNTSAKGRIIYTFHVIEGEGATYDARNWLQPPAEGFTRLYA